MDQLKDTISNISIYDVKAYVRKAQNVVMNYTEMEAKVREATNNEPWGASSTLMKDIAQGTNFSQEFHEIMPMIYKRFTDKSAAEWRQIYKALQLLEFLVKNGSERVVDYARSHIGVIEMLKHFHYVDSNAKDQGINIRNRAKELMGLLGDIEKIRVERKKARSNNTKYGGVGSDDAGFGGSGKKYGGFGSESLEFGSGYEGQVFGDGGGFNGSNYIGPAYNRHEDDEFEEYDVEGSNSSSRPAAGDSSSSTRQSPPSLPKKKTAEPVADFISFDDDLPASAPASANADDDDDFNDFQSATPVANNTSSSKALGGTNLADLFASTSIGNSPQQPAAQPSFLSAAPQPQQHSFAASSASTFSSSPLAASTSAATPAPKKADAFGDLWSSAAGSKASKPGAPVPTSLASLASQSAKNSMWAPQPGSGSVNPNGSGSAASPAPAQTSQPDDLLSF